MIRDARLFVRGDVHEVHRRTLQSGILTSMSGDAGEYELRLARAEDGEFLIEMARLACTLDGRPVPSGDDPEVVGVLPVAGDAAIIAEDRDMLESTDPDAIVDMSRKIEMHMPSDRPGMIMRNRLLELLRKHGEEEQPREHLA